MRQLIQQIKKIKLNYNKYIKPMIIGGIAGAILVPVMIPLMWLTDIIYPNLTIFPVLITSIPSLILLFILEPFDFSANTNPIDITGWNIVGWILIGMIIGLIIGMRLDPERSEKYADKMIKDMIRK